MVLMLRQRAVVWAPTKEAPYEEQDGVPVVGRRGGDPGPPPARLHADEFRPASGNADRDASVGPESHAHDGGPACSRSILARSASCGLSHPRSAADLDAHAADFGVARARAAATESRHGEAGGNTPPRWVAVRGMRRLTLGRSRTTQTCPRGSFTLISSRGRVRP